MIDLHGELSAVERIVPSVDKAALFEANRLVELSAMAGTKVVKLGLEAISSSEIGPEMCSDITGRHGVDWGADAKLHDIPTTVAKTIREDYLTLEHPPAFITMHADAEVDSMRAAQEVAAEAGITIMAVTVLTTTTEIQLRSTLRLTMRQLGASIVFDNIMEAWSVEGGQLRKAMVYARGMAAAKAGVGGLVASADELIDPINLYPALRGKVKMIPATRLPGADHHDQKNVGTPARAIEDGADLLVFGRPLFGTQDEPASDEQVIENFGPLVENIQLGLDARECGHND